MPGWGGRADQTCHLCLRSSNSVCCTNLHLQLEVYPQKHENLEVLMESACQGQCRPLLAISSRLCPALPPRVSTQPALISLLHLPSLGCQWFSPEPALASPSICPVHLPVPPLTQDFSWGRRSSPRLRPSPGLALVFHFPVPLASLHISSAGRI